MCTGNVCRSPYTAAVLTAWFDAVAPGLAQVTSCGVAINNALTVPRPVRRAVVAAGATLDGFETRSLTPQLVRQSDLVLVATSKHRTSVIDESPGAARRTFRILEFAHRARQEPPMHPLRTRDDWTAYVARLSGLRTRRDLDLDVPDPFGGSQAAFDAMVASLDPALRTIVTLAVGR